VLRKSELRRLYSVEGLSAREIARRAEVSHATVLKYFGRYGIEVQERDFPSQRKGQIPFGWTFRDAGLVKDPIEQEIIRMMRQYTSTGESFRGIARELNRKLVPTKNNGIWQANTVRKILKRVEGGKRYDGDSHESK
jgi:DNA invertase Pin-like site-specific DNA recombinase